MNPQDYRHRGKPRLGAKLDTSHPLAQGLLAAWLFNESTGAIAGDLTGNAPLFGINAPIWTPGDRAINTKTDGTTSYWHNTSLVLPTQAVSVVMYCRAPYSGSTGSAFGNLDANSNNISRLQAHLPYTGVIYWDFGGGSAGGGGRIEYQPDTGFWNRWNLMTFVAGNGFQGIYENTTLKTSYAGNLTRTPGLTGFDIGRGLSINYNPNYVEFCYLYNRVLSPADIATLYASPYQMVLPPPSRRFYVPGITWVYSTDNATGAETFTPTALYNATDTAAQTDNYQLNNLLLSTETGTETDSFSALSALYNAGDAGTGVETPYPIAVFSTSDIGTETDSVLTTALYAALDVGNLTEAAGLLVTIAGLESGGASESGGVLGSNLSLLGSDAGTWSDAALLSVLLALSETGAGQDALLRPGTQTVRTILTAIRKRLINVTSGHH